MQRAISSYVFIKQRLHSGLLDIMVRGGAEAIEIFAARDHFDYSNRTVVREIASWFQSTGVQLNSIHSPMFSDYEWGRSGSAPINFVDGDKRRRIESMDEIKRAIEVAEVLPFRFLVQHIGTGNESWDPHKFDHAMSGIEHLNAFARPLGVTLLVENIPNEMSTPDRLVELLTSAHFTDVGMCFDFGHANIMSRVTDAFDTMSKYIRSTHVHDNDGNKDSHLWPGNGTIDWDEAISLLRTAPHAPPLLLELDGEGQSNVEQKLSESFRKLETAKTAR